MFELTKIVSQEDAFMYFEILVNHQISIQKGKNATTKMIFLTLVNWKIIYICPYLITSLTMLVLSICASCKKLVLSYKLN